MKNETITKDDVHRYAILHLLQKTLENWCQNICDDKLVKKTPEAAEAAGKIEDAIYDLYGIFSDIQEKRGSTNEQKD